MYFNECENSQDSWFKRSFSKKNNSSRNQEPYNELHEKHKVLRKKYDELCGKYNELYAAFNEKKDNLDNLEKALVELAQAKKTIAVLREKVQKLQAQLEESKRLLLSLSTDNQIKREMFRYIALAKCLIPHLSILAGLNTAALCHEYITLLEDELDLANREIRKYESAQGFSISVSETEKMNAWYPVLDQVQEEALKGRGIAQTAEETEALIARYASASAPDRLDPAAYYVAFMAVRPYVREYNRIMQEYGDDDPKAWELLARNAVNMATHGLGAVYPKLAWDNESAENVDLCVHDFSYPALYYVDEYKNRILISCGARTKRNEGEKV